MRQDKSKTMKIFGLTHPIRLVLRSRHVGVVIVAGSVGGGECVLRKHVLPESSQGNGWRECLHVVQPAKW